MDETSIKLKKSLSAVIVSELIIWPLIIFIDLLISKTHYTGDGEGIGRGLLILVIAFIICLIDCVVLGIRIKDSILGKIIYSFFTFIFSVIIFMVIFGPMSKLLNFLL